jgi:rod shape determining protein RodA
MMMMREKERLLLSFDWILFVALLALSGAGLLAIWSTTDGTSLNSYLGRQVIYLGLAVLAFLVVTYFDYHIYSDFISLLYAAGLVALVLVLLVGHTIHNNKSWINLGPLTLQPSELVKILVIVALAKYYSESDKDHLDLRELVIGGMIVFVPMGLVVMQGDLGTAVTFLPVYMALSFLGGIKRKHIIIMILAIAAAAPVTWMMLHDYQKGRIEMVFNPSQDPHKLGYQTIQSEIAIGSGRFFGKGLKQGSQGNLGFLPARHTDFVFAVLSEEKGFIGSISILALFLLVVLRLLKGAREAKDKIGAMVVIGVLSLILFHIVINMGMVMGLLPIMGIPLPFVSAGGSSLLSCFAALGLCMNVRMRRYVN